MAENKDTDREEIVRIDVYKIEDPPLILHPDENLEDLRELAESIKEQGLLQPITVRPLGDHYQLVIGHRRLKAAKQFGILQLPARILNLDDKNALIAASTENLSRLDQDPVQEATLYSKLIKDHAMSEEEIAKKFGKGRSYVHTRVQLLELPDVVQEFVKNRSLSIGAAFTLTKLATHDEQIKLAVEMKGAGMTIERAQHFVNSYIYYKQQQAEAPQVEIIQQALAEPERECPLCHAMKKIHDFVIIQCCSECSDYITYLRVRDRTGADQK